MMGTKKKMNGFKGFNKDLTCRDFQFKEGEVFTEDEAKLCDSGFHFCEHPLDCFSYYPPADSVYHTVEAERVSSEIGNDTKRVAKTIKIGARLDICNIVKATVEYVWERATLGENSSNTGGYGAAKAKGNHSCAFNAGFAGKVKGALGCGICCVERDPDDGKILHIRADIVDGEKIKADTWYTVKNGEWVEVE